jgi:hypothetical protein
MGQRAIPSGISRHSYHPAEQTVKNKKLDYRVIGKYELMHLEGLERGRPHPFDRVPWTFEEELVRLRSFGLIDHIEGKGIVAMKQEGQGDLHDHFRITDLGKNYLKLRREMVSELKGSAESASE